MNWPDDYINKVICGDCLEAMKGIPDGSINLVVADPPYNIGKDAWDKIKNYDTWLQSVFFQIQRVLKANGSFYWFHSETQFISNMMHWMEKHTDFMFNSKIIWDKGNFRALSWKEPGEDSFLRSWFNTCEFIMLHTFQDQTGLQMVEKEYIAPRNPFAKELKKARLKAGVSINQVAEYGHFYGEVNHGGAVTNWERGYNVPLKEQWKILCRHLPIKRREYESLRREYESLRREYESLRREYESLRYTHNLDNNHNNIFKSNIINSGKYHPTEKPLDIIGRLIKCSSNKGDIVLDPFGGSGTSMVSCRSLGRNFIGIEKEKKYCAIANKRLNQQVLEL